MNSLYIYIVLEDDTIFALAAKEETRGCYSHRSRIRTRLRFSKPPKSKIKPQETKTMATCGLWTPPSFSPRRRLCNFSSSRRPSFSVIRFDRERVSPRRVSCSYNNQENDRDHRPQSSGIQVYGEIER